MKKDTVLAEKKESVQTAEESTGKEAPPFLSTKEEKKLVAERAQQKKKACKARKSAFREIWKNASHRRRLRAASVLLCLGAFGITYAVHCCSDAFGIRERLVLAAGAPMAAGIAAGACAVLSVFLLYPLWLGMLSYAEALWRGEAETDGYLFSYYTDRRFRRFAFRQGAFHAIRFGALFALMIGCAFWCFRLADAWIASGASIRAAFILALLAGIMLALPAWFLITETDFSLARSRYREDGNCSVWEARRRSCRDMRGHRLEIGKLVLGSVPGMVLSFILFGVGIPLWVIPRFVLHAAGFSAALHKKQKEKHHGKRKMLYHDCHCVCVEKTAFRQYI